VNIKDTFVHKHFWWLTRRWNYEIMKTRSSHVFFNYFSFPQLTGQLQLRGTFEIVTKRLVCPNQWNKTNNLPRLLHSSLLQKRDWFAPKQAFAPKRRLMTSATVGKSCLMMTITLYRRLYQSYANATPIWKVCDVGVSVCMCVCVCLCVQGRSVWSFVRLCLCIRLCLV
jgi:hypothetical protein